MSDDLGTELQEFNYKPESSGTRKHNTRESFRNFKYKFVNWVKNHKLLSLFIGLGASILIIGIVFLAIILTLLKLQQITVREKAANFYVIIRLSIIITSNCMVAVVK